MKNAPLAVLAVALIASQPVRAQDSIPLLKGTVNISITQGTFDCDLVMENVPSLSNYFLRLNSGMNILSIKDLDRGYLIDYGKSVRDTTSSDTNAYFFWSNAANSKYLPEKMEIRYTGKYPVANDTINNFQANDWKGNIAFNGYSVRVDGSQTCWYPVIYDISKDRIMSKVRYDLQVNCPDCSVIYLNGSPPAKGAKAELKSKIPVDLCMYSGKFDVSNIDGTYFLNSGLTDSQARDFGTLTNSIKKFYEDRLKIPYTTRITYVQTTPTSRHNAWLFVSYPTIYNIGYGKYSLKGFIDPKNGNSFKPYVAHELGHYYFANYRSFNSGLGDMMTEAFAEYLSLAAAKNVMGDSTYQKDIDKKIRFLKNFNATPFANVKSQADYKNRELYVYYYAPLIFKAIEIEIGEQKMWLWLNTVLTMPAEHTDYNFLKGTLEKTLGPKEAAPIEAKYFASDEALDNAIKEIRQ